MSATLEASRFSEYFHNAPIIHISGRQVLHYASDFVGRKKRRDYLLASESLFIIYVYCTVSC